MEERTKGYNLLNDLNPSQREAVEHIEDRFSFWRERARGRPE